MGQRNQLEMMLAAIRRKKSLYRRKLDEVHSIDGRNQLKKDIDSLSREEEKILGQLKYDEVF